MRAKEVMIVHSQGFLTPQLGLEELSKTEREMPNLYYMTRTYMRDSCKEDVVGASIWAPVLCRARRL